MKWDLEGGDLKLTVQLHNGSDEHDWNCEKNVIIFTNSHVKYSNKNDKMGGGWGVVRPWAKGTCWGIGWAWGGPGAVVQRRHHAEALLAGLHAPD